MASPRRRARAATCLAALLIASGAAAAPRGTGGPLRPSPALAALSRHPALAAKADRAPH